MKSIVYILIIVFICGILVSAYPKSNSNQKQVVEIQCVVNNPDSKLLDESCLIIKKRLNDNEVKNFDMSINSQRGIIEITFNEKIDLKDISLSLRAPAGCKAISRPAIFMQKAIDQLTQNFIIGIIAACYKIGK